MNNLKKTIIKYASAAVIGACLCVLVLWLSGYSSELAPSEKYKILTDVFSGPGSVFIMIGCLVAVSTSGFFDMLSYGFGKAARMLIPMSKKNDETFYDYKMRKNEDRLSGYSFIFFTGLAFLLISIVFLILFYCNYQ